MGTPETESPSSTPRATLPGDHAPRHQGQPLTLLMLTALGVVFGDIGTSPLYALRECFHGHYALPASPENVIGVLSLILWSLIAIISVKYIVFIMRADNRGEGGILALSALVSRTVRKGGGAERWTLVALGLFGAALLYGDGVITPAISVLSAVEGLKIATPIFDRFVVPITCVILVGLFLVQKRGTAGVGTIFGPIMLVYFVVIAGLGIRQIAMEPRVFEALAPWHALGFLTRNGFEGFKVLGSVFLVVTGGEALYADMGHFGRRPIQLAWFGLAFPALLLNYFGQGALLLADPLHAENPFYHLVPEWGLLPMVVLATLATVIASQALISGAFSLTRQAVQLGYSPRMEIRHTSAEQIGQIFVPSVNMGLMIACIGLVIQFRTSSNLAAAYGVAVTATMAITTILFYFVARERWRWNPAVATGITGLFLILDLNFLGANLLKIHDGGWVPLAIGLAIFTLMVTWKRGRQILMERHAASEFPIELFLRDMGSRQVLRVPGTAIFMYRNPYGIPSALLHNLKHNKVIHQKTVLLTVTTEEVPHVTADERVRVEELGHGFYRVVIRYGFMQDPNIPEILGQLNVPGLDFKPMETTYFLGRETIVATRRPGMARWRERLFGRMIRNERTATSFFKLPPNRVVELGEQIEL